MTEHSSFLIDKLRHLQEVEDCVTSLRSQLLAAESLREQIKRDITSYEWSRTKFSMIPPELLCLIFSFIHEEQHVRNYRLGLVCKSWRVLVVGTPQLWTQITVGWSGGLHRLLSSWDYVRMCLERSMKISLDLTIDFAKLPTLINYLSRLVDPLILDAFPLGRPLRDYNLRTSEVTNTNSLQYQYLVENSMRVLRGDNSVPTPTWRSLRLLLPEHLRRFDLNGILSEVLEASIHIEELEYIVEAEMYRHDGRACPVELPVFPLLQHLVSNQYVTLQNDSTIGKTLTSLTLGNHRASLSFLSQAGSTYTALKYLSVYTETRGNWGILNVAIATHFPSLTELKLEGPGQTLVLPLFNAPKLHTLHLDGLEFQHCPKATLFPGITELVFSVAFWYLNMGMEKLFGEAFETLLALLPKLRSFTVQCRSVDFDPACQLTARTFDERKANMKCLYPSLRIFVAEIDGTLRRKDVAVIGD